MISPARAAESMAITTVALKYEHDVVLARQRARDIAAALDFDVQEQVRFATAVSELSRNAFQYATNGRVLFSIEREGERSMLMARVQDDGPGIADLPRILDGRYSSSTGMGIGITGARRLSDRFFIETDARTGTQVAVGKIVGHSRAPLTPDDVARVAERLSKAESHTPFDELQRQNQELLAALDALNRKNAEVERLALELEETNRGVVALYQELDDRALQLGRFSESKTRFLSDVSHELRTPLSSIVNLARLLLAHSDGPLAAEQERQVRLMLRSAEWLSEMVSDLLDVAKIEAGKVEPRPDRFTVEALFAALRGMFRPLATNERVALVIEDPRESIALFTDEQRLSQILRNFVSNALKFTSEGEVCVSARAESPDTVRFSVRDTGIGIAASDLERIFQDFQQVDGPIQRRVRGTGLGLPLTRKLAVLLGGEVSVESAVGKGSTFSVVIPRELAPPDVPVAKVANG